MGTRTFSIEPSAVLKNSNNERDERGIKQAAKPPSDNTSGSIFADRNCCRGARTVVGQKTVADQLGLYGPAARARWEPIFARKKLSYPAKQIMFVAFKESRKLEVYATNDQNAPVYLCSYPVVAASGVSGPKLREGDRQVPEGIYKLTPEPNTPYHLALRLNYPNELDWAHAKQDGRENPGSDILIHGSNGSIGCLAMGDPVSEDLFVLACDAENKRSS